MYGTMKMVILDQERVLYLVACTNMGKGNNVKLNRTKSW